MMRDCENAGMRDLLPELLHVRLGPTERAEVERHVAGCDDCAAELALLRRAQASLGHAPAVDVARILAALPRAGARRRPARFTGWRVAAGIAAVLVGAVSFRIAQQSGAGGVPAAPSVASSASAERSPALVTGTQAESIAAVGRAAGVPRATRAAAPALTPAGGLADLSEAELQLLLGRFDGLSGVPDAEPDADVSPVTLDEGVS